MINAILIFNNQGKPRLVKFYKYIEEKKKQEILVETFKILSSRQVGNSRSATERTYCSFIDHGLLTQSGANRIIYRHYATLYFVFAVDKCESELGILDLIQVLVEVLDRVFENVCELDLIFHMDKVQYILSEMVQGGMVLETSLSTIVQRINEQNKLEQDEKSTTITSVVQQGALNLNSVAQNLSTMTDKFPSFAKFSLKKWEGWDDQDFKFKVVY